MAISSVYCDIYWWEMAYHKYNMSDKCEMLYQYLEILKLTSEFYYYNRFTNGQRSSCLLSRWLRTLFLTSANLNENFLGWLGKLEFILSGIINSILKQTKQTRNTETNWYRNWPWLWSVRAKLYQPWN